MSYRDYYKQHSKEKSVTDGGDEPVVNRFSDVQKIDRRRHEVLDYLIMGYHEDDIAEFLGVKPEVVLSDMEAIAEKGYQAREDDVEEVREEIMTILRLAAKESYRAFKSSQGEVETKTVEYGEGGDMGNGNRNIESEKVKTEVQSGDARHMKNVIDAAEKMGKVSGAQKHKEVEVKQNVQNNTMNILSPNRTKMPSDFDRWTKKPEDADLPDGKNVDMENI